MDSMVFLPDAEAGNPDVTFALTGAMDVPLVA
jgi:hypothetical protein